MIFFFFGACTEPYIYSHPQTDLFRYIRTLQWGKTGKIPEAGIETRLTQMPIQILPLNHEETRASEGHLNTYLSQLFLFYIYPLNGYRDLDSYEEPCITLVATHLLPSLESSTLKG